MTRADFLPRFLHALIDLNAEVLTTYPHVYPTGPLIRVKVRPGWDVGLPPLVDPIGALWLAEMGEFRSVLDSAYLAMVRLELPELAALACLQAADLPVTKLVDLEARHWRRGFEEVITAYHTSRNYGWR